MCALVGTVLIDPDGVYDPRSSNDRLLLGIKGTMSEFELHLMRERAQEAQVAKARRGALRIALPVGYCWEQGQLVIDPDQRVQKAIALVFRKFAELRSARQVFLWLAHRQLRMPVRYPAHRPGPVTWERPTYDRVLSIVSHPAYAGAYAFGRTGGQTRLVEGAVRKTSGHARPREQWLALIRDHHPGYISWVEHERNLAMLAENAHRRKDGERKTGRGGQALLSGTLRCQQCGRMLRVRYGGTDGSKYRYLCRRDEAEVADGKVFCLTVSGPRVDRVLSEELLRVVEPRAIEAALQVTARWQEEQEQVRRARALELEQARYEATLAARRYEQVDPDNRLVAGELEARWNASLSRVAALEQVLQQSPEPAPAGVSNPEQLMVLARDLPRVWNAPTTDSALKQRIVSILIREVIIGVDAKTNEVVLTTHWVGEQHSEVRLGRRRDTRSPRVRLGPEEVVKKMAGRWPEREIALTLNRLRLRTSSGDRWTQVRVRSMRQRLGLPEFDANQAAGTVNLAAAAARLAVSQQTVRKLVAQGLLRAEQPVPCGPWVLQLAELDDGQVRAAAQRIQARRPVLPPPQQPPLPGVRS